MAYEGLAEIYDCLMTDTDYNAWADYIDQLYNSIIVQAIRYWIWDVVQAISASH